MSYQFPPEKPKYPPPPPGSVRVGVFALATFMLLFGVLIGAIASFLSVPTLFNWDATQAALSTRQSLLEGERAALSTAQAQYNEQQFALEAMRTRLAQDTQATALAQDNLRALLQQTATQSMQNVLATQTAAVVSNQQQQTQVALDYASTQAALQQNATQVELNFRATQAALGAGSANSTPAPRMASATPTPSPTPTVLSMATVAPLPFDPLTPAAPARIVLNMSEGVPSALQASLDGNTAGWERRNNGLSATRDEAWLITRAVFDGDLAFGMAFVPAITPNAGYDLLLNVGGRDALLVRLSVQNLTANALNVYRVNSTPPFSVAGLTPIASSTLNLPLGAYSTLNALLQGGQLTITGNERVLLAGVDVSFFTTGAIGVQLPKDATLLEFALTP
jgi:uncharacterized membrane-anchored protein YhcB (DUF1043 family)